MTTPSPQHVLVAGGTGGTGRLVVRRLALLRIPARVLTRDRHRAAALGRVDVVEGDARAEEDCRRALDGCDRVICTAGRHKARWQGPSVDGDGVINLARAAERAEVRRFVLVSALGVAESWQWLPRPVKWLLQLIDLRPLLRDKARSEEFVRSSGLAWTILRPGFLHGGPMRADPVLTVSGQVPGVCGRQALADVAVRCLEAHNAPGRVLAIADGWCRRWLRGGEPFQLDVPWASWSSSTGARA
jgi:uncharacterized protein YbjT (DUF2867 family)